MIVMLAGEMALELLAGEVMLTVGGTLADGFTVTEIAAEVVMAPELSVALAASE